MKRGLVALVTVCTIFVLLAPRDASAEWVVSPYVGPTFGADIGSLAIAPALGGERKLTYGGSIGYLAPGFLGVELDLAYAPSFFEGGTVLSPLVNSSVTTAMANVVVAGPRGRGPSFGPYVSGGIGLMRTEVGDGLNLVRVRHTALGANGGAGFLAFVSDRVGLRADLRYFRSLEEGNGPLDLLAGNLNFLRGTVGMAVRF